MTLWSFKTYRYIGSKTKNYQTQRRFLLLFIFFPDLGLQAVCFPILSLRPHAFRSFSSGRMPSGSLTNMIAQALNLRSVPIIETPRLLSPSLIPCQETHMATLESSSLLLLHCCNRGNWTPGSYICYVQQAILSPPAWRFQKPKALCEDTNLAGVDLYDDQVIGSQL